MVSKWFQNGPKMVPGWGEKGFGVEFGVENASWTGSDTKTSPILDPKWTKISPDAIKNKKKNESKTYSEFDTDCSKFLKRLHIDFEDKIGCKADYIFNIM